jgi:CysZ protein
LLGTSALEIFDRVELVSKPSILLPVARAVSQLNDPTFRGVLVKSIAWSIASFAALHVGAVWIIGRIFELHGLLAWGVGILGSIATSLLTLWLFLPVAAAIGTMYLDRIAISVERRFYPWLPPASGTPFLEQAWDGVVVALKVLGLNLVALILAFILPGIGLVLGWLIAAYAIGRGLFVAVVMRRMPRTIAESLYRSSRGSVLVQGAVLALAAYVPILNLLIPIIGVAAMVHVLDMALTAAERPERLIF